MDMHKALQGSYQSHYSNFNIAVFEDIRSKEGYRIRLTGRMNPNQYIENLNQVSVI